MTRATRVIPAAAFSKLSSCLSFDFMDNDLSAGARVTQSERLPVAMLQHWPTKMTLLHRTVLLLAAVAQLAPDSAGTATQG